MIVHRAAAVVGAVLVVVASTAAGQRVVVQPSARSLEQPPPAGALTARDISRGEQSNIDDRREVVVRRPVEWQALWRAHNFELPLPRVDFAREMVVAVFLGSQTSAGYSVRIIEVRPLGEAVVVRYQIGRPAADAVAAQVLTFPYHIIAVPMRSGAVRFERQLP